MRNICHRLALAAFGPLLMTSGAVQADVDIMDGKATLSAEVDVGLQQKHVDGAALKFEEYRDVQNGFLLNDLRLKIDGKAVPYYLDITIQNPVQDNEYYRIDGGVHGKYKFGAFYDSIPHNFASGTLILTGAGSGLLTIADTTQLALQANDLLRVGRGAGNPNPKPPFAQDAAQQAIIRDLNANAGQTEFKLKREKGGVSFESNLTDTAKAWAKLSNEKKTGTRVISTGTYERYPQTVAGTHVSDLFLVSGMELAEPINYRTTMMNFGLGFYEKTWMLDGQYTLTNFNNHDDSLMWENPFRATSLSSSNSAGLTTTSNGDFNRGRFSIGQLSLPPDSRSHDFTVSGSVDLPVHSKLTGTISYGVVTQDDAFLPYTLNTAIAGVGAPGFTAPATVTSTAALPVSNLNGKVNSLSQSYVLTSKPMRSLTVTAKYRYYDYDNKSSAITFPGYAAYGESYWRTGNNDPRAAANAGVISQPLSYTRQNAELGIDYHLLKSLTVMLDGGWENWDRKNLRINSTSETSVGLGFMAKPMAYAKLSGHYKHARRTVDGYKDGNSQGNPEAIGQVNFDWAGRVRKQADVRFTMSPVESVTLGISGKTLKDDLGGDNRFGLKSSEQSMGAFDLAYNPSEELSVYANYVRESSKGFMQSAAKDNAVAGENWFARNYWNSDTHDTTDTIGLGLTAQLIPRKLTLDTSYNLSSSKMDVGTSNPGLSPTTLLNAVAQPWPTVKNRTETFKANLAYNVAANTLVGVTYLYEKYKLDDFANTPAYIADTSVENSTKFLFTGANNFSYKAQVVGVYLKTEF